jgi:hypothetical protein
VPVGLTRDDRSHMRVSVEVQVRLE